MTHFPRVKFVNQVDIGAPRSAMVAFFEIDFMAIRIAMLQPAASMFPSPFRVIFVRYL